MIFTDLYDLLTSLTFYGGVNEIGGNKILLEDKDTRVFLDFGKRFSRRAKFVEEYINPRVANGIEDFLTMGLLPHIKGGTGIIFNRDGNHRECCFSVFIIYSTGKIKI